MADRDAPQTDPAPLAETAAVPERPQLTLPPAEAEMVRRYYDKAGVILEYGSGGSTVLAGDMPGKVITSVESDRAWVEMMKAWFRDNPPKSLKSACAGGMALQDAVAKRWKEVTRTPVVEGYGLTESSPVLTFNPLDAVKEGTIGVPVPSTDIKCVDDAGNEVPIGQPGELIARGPQIMAGYWRKPDETAKTIRDGWLYTGDVATQDEDGYFRIVDRKKDMVLVSGFNVFPNEVEDTLAKHPAVLEVAVVGVPDGAAGEAVKAFIVKRPEMDLDVEQVRAFCKEHLTGYKVPKFVEFRTELPKSNVGKILRKDLRAEDLAKAAKA